jgi:Sep15/SelM redox domain
LNRYPELKSFLKDGEAEQYAGIKVTYVAGRTAVLTIYQNQQKQEEVVLHELKNKAAMHALFRQKGFVLKSELVKQGTDPHVGEAKAGATTTIGTAAMETDAAAGQQSNQTAQQQQEAAEAEAEAAAIQVLRLGAAAALRRQDNADAAAAGGGGGGGRGRRKKNNNNARNKKNASSKASSQQGGVVVDGGGGAGSSSWSEMLQLYAFLTAAVLLAAGSYKGLRGRYRGQGSGIGGSSSRLWRRAR